MTYLNPLFPSEKKSRSLSSYIRASNRRSRFQRQVPPRGGGIGPPRASRPPPRAAPWQGGCTPQTPRGLRPPVAAERGHGHPATCSAGLGLGSSNSKTGGRSKARWARPGPAQPAIHGRRRWMGALSIRRRAGQAQCGQRGALSTRARQYWRWARPGPAQPAVHGHRRWTGALSTAPSPRRWSAFGGGRVGGPRWRGRPGAAPPGRHFARSARTTLRSKV